MTGYLELSPSSADTLLDISSPRTLCKLTKRMWPQLALSVLLTIFHPTYKLDLDIEVSQSLTLGSISASVTLIDILKWSPEPRTETERPICSGRKQQSYAAKDVGIMGAQEYQSVRLSVRSMKK